MGKADWKNPLNPPVQVKGHADEDDVLNECPGLDTTAAWVVVAGISKDDSNNDDYNCLGWVLFCGPKNARKEPDFEDPGSLADTTKALEGAGWKACKSNEATCVVVAANAKSGPYTRVSHVFLKWKPRGKVDSGWAAAQGGKEWWESKMGQGGPQILHARDAMKGDANYGTEIGWFN